MTNFDPAAEGWRPMRGAPFPAGIGIPWSKRVNDSWRYGLLTTAEHANPQGVVHGGILMTFADQGLSLLAWQAAWTRALHDDPIEHAFSRQRFNRATSRN